MNWLTKLLNKLPKIGQICWVTRLKMHSVLYTRVPRLLMQTWLSVWHYKTALHCSYYKTTENFCRHATACKATSLRPDNATWALPGCFGSFSNCIQALCSHVQWQDTKLHARSSCGPAAVAGYQTARVAALLQCQVLKLLHWVKDEQTCNNNNSNNKDRCIRVEPCKLS
jgi:hypothetical protein